jgi:CIC family chloride channel protein
VIRRTLDALRRLLPQAMLREFWRTLALSALVGIVAGLGAIAFFALLEASRWFFLDFLAGYQAGHPGGEAPLFAPPASEFRRWVLVLVPALGGLLSGALVVWLAPEAGGHGTDAAIAAYHRGGSIRKRVPLIKAVSAAITIGSGGSGGREGPIAQIGAAFGDNLARWLRLRPHERRVLLAAGMAAGVGAIFHAPLAGALFAAEVLYSDLDLEVEVLIPAVISSITAYAVFASWSGWEPLFTTPVFSFQNPLELGPYLVLALVVAGGAALYVRVFYGLRDAFRALHIPRALKPALGGLGVGMIGFFLPEALGTGYGLLQRAIDGQAGLGLLFAVAGLKILTTGLSIGSGGSGGVFGPAVVVGGALGGGTGLLLQQVFPGLDLHPGAFALVGMAGFFAAAANTPISTLIMVSEMTGNYHLLVPSMWVCFLATMLCRRHQLYENQLANRFLAPGHLGEMLEAVLCRIQVSRVLGDRACLQRWEVGPGTDLHELSELFARSGYTSFPVVDQAGRLTAMVQGRELREALGSHAPDHLVVAADLAHPPVTITPEDDLLLAIQRMTAHRTEELIVVEPQDPTRAICLLSRGDVVAAYHDALVRERGRASQPGSSPPGA